MTSLTTPPPPNVPPSLKTRSSATNSKQPLLKSSATKVPLPKSAAIKSPPPDHDSSLDSKVAKSADNCFSNRRHRLRWYQSLKVTRRRARVLEVATPTLATFAGLFHASPSMFYLSALGAFATLFGFIVVNALFWHLMGHTFGTRIQDDKEDPLVLALHSAHARAAIARDVLANMTGLFSVACLLAWPVANLIIDAPTGLTWALDEDIRLAPVSFALKIIAIALLVDAYSYLKHRALHLPALCALHTNHHSHSDTTALFAFNAHPVEALATFLPVISYNYIPHPVPVVAAAMVVQMALNGYSHCGYRLAALEGTLPYFFMNTSAYHNVHHRRGGEHFGEIFSIWDLLFATTTVYDGGLVRGMRWNQSDFVYRNSSKRNESAKHCAP